MEQYHELLQHVLDKGRQKTDRTGTGTISIFGAQARYNLLGEIPAITTKKLFFKGAIRELVWMIRGDTNINYLTEENVNIWNEWATEDGELGPVYGEMWRKFPIARPLVGSNAHTWSVDQLKSVVDELNTNPDSRRLVVSAWHPALLPDVKLTPSENAAAGKQALPPCHTLFQFNTVPMTFKERCEYTSEDIMVEGEYIDVLPESEALHDVLDDYSVPRYYLSCQLYQRSADLFLGVPFNIFSYSILTYMVAKICNMVPLEFVHTMGDAHIYTNHVEQVKKQLKRKHKKAPTLEFSDRTEDIETLDEFEPEDIIIKGYTSHPAIKAEVAV